MDQEPVIARARLLGVMVTPRLRRWHCADQTGDPSRPGATRKRALAIQRPPLTTTPNLGCLVLRRFRRGRS